MNTGSGVAESAAIIRNVIHEQAREYLADCVWNVDVVSLTAGRPEGKTTEGLNTAAVQRPGELPRGVKCVGVIIVRWLSVSVTAWISAVDRLGAQSIQDLQMSCNDVHLQL